MFRVVIACDLVLFCKPYPRNEKNVVHSHPPTLPVNPPTVLTALSLSLSLFVVYCWRVKDSQPSPLALLAATCSKIGGVAGEGQAGVPQQIIIDPSQGLLQLQNPTQQLELVPAQFTGNGWQIITASAPATITKDSLTQAGVTIATAASSDGTSGRKVKVIGANSAPAGQQQQPQQQQQQFQIIQVQNMPNSTGGIQYQVIPHIQTADGQQIQINPASATSLSLQPEQIQLISAGNNQAILATPQRAGSANIVTQNVANQAIPLQIRPSFPLQLQTIQGAQTPMVTTVPINIGGMTLALPVINNMAGSGAAVQLVQPGDVSVSNGNLIAAPMSTVESSGIVTCTTTTTATDAVAVASVDSTTLSTAVPALADGDASEKEAQTQQAEADSQNPPTTTVTAAGTIQVQANGLQPTGQDQMGQQQQIQQFHIVGHPVLQQIQIQQPQQQQLVPGSIQLQPGQTLQPVQQNLQLQAFQNPAQVLIRAPTLSPSGQISWQTVQVQNAAMPQQLTLAPVASGAAAAAAGGGATFTQITPLALGGTPITLNAAQLSSGTGVQTVNIAGLGAAGVQVQGVPLTITGVQGNSAASTHTTYSH